MLLVPYMWASMTFLPDRRYIRRLVDLQTWSRGRCRFEKLLQAIILLYITIQKPAYQQY